MTAEELGRQAAFSAPNDLRCAGMTYRQWLVGQALKAVGLAGDVPTDLGRDRPAAVGRLAIRIADAILAELAKE